MYICYMGYCAMMRIIAPSFLKNAIDWTRDIRCQVFAYHRYWRWANGGVRWQLGAARDRGSMNPSQVEIIHICLLGSHHRAQSYMVNSYLKRHYVLTLLCILFQGGCRSQRSYASNRGRGIVVAQSSQLFPILSKSYPMHKGRTQLISCWLT